MLKPFLLVLACLAVAPGAYALCFVSPSGNPICQEFWQYDAVFDGTVTSIRQERGVASAEWIGLREVHRVVTFEVHRTWRGESARSVQLVLPGGDGLWVEDTLVVKQGLRYVIFAGRMPSGHLSASECGPSALFERSKDALAFLESLSRPASGGRIFGIVYDTTKRSEGVRFPAVETELVLEGRVCGASHGRRAVRSNSSSCVRASTNCRSCQGDGRWPMRSPLRLP
jgi:hypothetical protein